MQKATELLQDFPFLWMDEVMHHLRIICMMTPLQIPSSHGFPWFLGGAGFCPSAVLVCRDSPERCPNTSFQKPAIAGRGSGVSSSQDIHFPIRESLVSIACKPSESFDQWGVVPELEISLIQLCQSLREPQVLRVALTE